MTTAIVSDAMPAPPPTPMHDRLSDLAAEAGIVSEFLEWLTNQGYEVCIPSPLGFAWAGKRPETLIAEWLEIDAQALEREKQAIIAYQAVLNAQTRKARDTERAS